jgi:hypothetical protein
MIGSTEKTVEKLWITQLRFAAVFREEGTEVCGIQRLVGWYAVRYANP